MISATAFQLILFILFRFVFIFKNQLTDLKLVIEDTIDNVATLQECHTDQGESLQVLGEKTLFLSVCLTSTSSHVLT